MSSNFVSRRSMHAALGATLLSLACQAALAQTGGLAIRGAAGDGGGNVDYAAQLAPPLPMLPAGHVPRYRITYMKSSTTAPLRSGTVISITNHGAAACSTSVDWFVGFGGVACTTTLNLGPGQTGEHCSRSLPSAIVGCNATCAPDLTAIEGSALVGAANVASCAALAISARTHFTTGTNDENLSSTSDAKVVRTGGTNNGD